LYGRDGLYKIQVLAIEFNSAKTTEKTYKQFLCIFKGTVGLQLAVKWLLYAENKHRKAPQEIMKYK